jgi:cation:H+ antiporter
MERRSAGDSRLIYVLGFIASGIVVVLAGTALARHADAIAEATGLGRIWIGSVLLAGATSLPELATDISAVRLGAVDLAVGDLFGSSMANMLILAVVDLVPPRRQVLQNVALDHVLAASFAISLNALAALLVLIRPAGSVLWVGPGSLGLLLAYVAGTRAVYRHATRERAVAAAGVPEQSDRQPPSLRRAVLRFTAAALVVLAAAPSFAWSAKGIAVVSGLGNTFVGTWLVGLATSLPEIATCLAAVRMGTFDLAVGNLFGSNAFNMAIFFALDAVEPGSLFAKLDPGHAVSGSAAVVLMSLGVAAIVYRAKRRFAMLEPDSLLIVLAYCGALLALLGYSRGS